MRQLPEGPYNFNETEKKLLQYWLENKFYKPEYDPRTQTVKTTEEMQADDRDPFCIICPPPNAYGRPHLGNISGYAYQDAMARYARQQGKKVLMVPGKDHAGLEGEGVFVRDVLEKEGTDKFSMTREEFYQRIWDFNQENMQLAQTDEKTIGLSADFDRDLFTLDPRIVDIVLSTFVDMYKQNMIYRGVRIINWDPKARTALADNQCIREERDGKLHYIKYPVVGSDEFITVATTRPETMFGDTAVAVNPDDERFKHLQGKQVQIPLTQTIIPIITSPRVLTDFGTGALKITPAHSQDDYTIRQEWNRTNPENQIGYVNVIGKDLKLVGPVPEKYKGQKYKAALETILADLQSAGLLIKSEDVKQNILKSERTGALIEPLISSQWFVDIDTLREPVMNMVREGKVKIHPQNMEAKFYYWMENLRDWAISRSLWWGYRLPVWYAGTIEERIDAKGEVEMWIETNGSWEPLNSANPAHMRVQLERPGEGWHQDPDVLDTWFSSGQWPYATLMTLGLMDTFYPTNVMETGFDILENWVSRMMMFSWFKLQNIPFKDVYLHGLVNGTDGQKMSKSKKNIIPLDEARDQYGLDALRMVYFYQNTAGASYSLTYEKLKMFRNFNNKIWNAAKFVINNSQELADDMLAGINNIEQFRELLAQQDLKLSEAAEQILNKVAEQEADYHQSFARFRFGNLTENLYQNFWHEFCDVYIEASKQALQGEDTQLQQSTKLVLVYSLRSFLKMLHPFIPHITDEVWQHIKADNEVPTLMYVSWK
jgi:valyl-tRNA synthetase